MIQLIQGPPRSGKSFFAVSYLMKFCKFDNLYMEYVLNPEVLIISNIEGLKIKHWDLTACLKDRTLQDFFSIANFEAIQAKTKKSHIILLIDECHDLFPAGMQDKDIYSFFAYHGHIGLDIFLMTQGIAAMSRMFNPLLEHIVQVTQRSKSVAGVFSYTFTDLKGRFLYTKILKKDRLVFGAYKSFRTDEQNKPKNALLMWAGMICAFLLVAGVVFYSALGTIEERSIIAKNKTEANKKIEELRAKSNNPSASSPAGSGSVETVASSPPVVDDPVQWRYYQVQGYYYINDRPESAVYVIRGKRIGADRTRNFDRELMMIEFYGLEIPPESRAYSGAAAGSVSGVEQIATQAPALAGAPASSSSGPDPFQVTFPIQDAPLHKYY